ncbi:MAG: OmpA/MotB domain protein, partial [Myxococcales bacterium]|nr:OmpA/MotB domain protein [Myxococcales bacterium]
MLRVLVLACALLVPSIAAATPTQLGIWFGPRIFNGDSGLGYIDDAPAHPSLHNGIELGARVSGQFFPFAWLIPEFELAVSPTSTTEACTTMGVCAASTGVVWLEPRFQFRFELAAGRPIQPFIVVGAGTPVALSSARMTFNSGISADGYIGGGVRFDTHKGFAFRFDARIAALQGVNHFLAPELDIGFGIDLLFGRKRAPSIEEATAVTSALSDKDGDGIPDAQDKCPDRPEDTDGFEDADGCPDIDNDLDRVLDVADKCINVPETYNGFEDDDGCPDSVPPDVEALKGTIEGLFYAETETVVRDSALPSLGKLAKVLIARPSVKVVLVGHTDDREAKAFVTA